MIRLKSIFIYLVIYLAAAFCSCGPRNLQIDYFPVDEVLNGSQVKLRNGYIVNLLGVSDSPETKDYLDKNVLNKKIRFAFDSHSPFYKLFKNAKSKSIYAYAIMEDGVCINSVLLNKHYSSIYITPYLTDSLSAYLSYSGDDNKNNLTIVGNTPSKDTIASLSEPKDESALFTAGVQGELDKLRQACDFMNPDTRNFAVRLAGKHSGNFSIDQIIDIFDSIRPPKWKYVEDPRKNEYYSSASNTLTKTGLTGDCDDFAILMYSLITAIGGEARISFAWKKIPDSDTYFGHAFTEVDIVTIPPETLVNTMIARFGEFNIDKINYDQDDKGVWLNLDWWAAYPGGKYMDYDARIIFYPNENTFDIPGIVQ